MDFWDADTGMIFGGDVTNPSGNAKNKAVTTDGGKTWNLVADEEDPGYKSSIQFVPGGDGKEVVATGFTGISYSYDFGKSCQKLSDEGFYTLRFLNDSIAYAVGKGRMAELRFKREEKMTNR